MKRKVIGLVIAISILLCGVVSLATSQVEDVIAQINYEINMRLNGVAYNPTETDGSALRPLIYKGRTYLPVAALGQALGISVKWDGDTSTVIIGEESNKSDNDETSISVPVSSKDDEDLSMPALIKYNKNGEIVRIVEINTDYDLDFLEKWVYLCDIFLEGSDGELKNINIRKDIAIKYNASTEIYIQEDQERYCYYINKERNVSSVYNMSDDQYAWVQEKIGGLDEEGNISGINYKIYNNYNQGRYDYSKRGYYIDTLNMPGSPWFCIITSAEKPEDSYIVIQDIKVDAEKNVEIIIKEHTGNPTYTDVVGIQVPKIYPACCVELLRNDGEPIGNITIKNTDGETFEQLLTEKIFK